MNEDDLTDTQYFIKDKFKDGENLFITGPGGVGKSYLIKHLIHHCIMEGKKYQVCALTGCAAILLGSKAKTIHSWSGIYRCDKEESEIIKQISSNWAIRTNWKKIQVLIVDEISMMSKKMLSCLDKLGKRFRKNTLPFGGIQVVFSGDFFQLPPINEDEFCFESEVWNNLFNRENHIELTEIFRQKDKQFIEILAEIRKGKLSATNLQVIEERLKVKTPEDITLLSPKKFIVDRINQSKFHQLDQAIQESNIIIRYDETNYIHTQIPIPPEKKKQLNEKERKQVVNKLIKDSRCSTKLKLKLGTYIMITANIHLEDGIANGTQGIIVGFSNNHLPLVQFKSNMTRAIGYHTWQSDDHPTITIRQLPMELAWATTIHKMQGASLDTAIMDLGPDIFEAGQIYVALSRVKSLEGLYLINFDPTVIKINKKVKKFYKTIPKIKIEIEETNILPMNEEISVIIEK